MSIANISDNIRIIVLMIVNEIHNKGSNFHAMINCNVNFRNNDYDN
jgi:hypothetical protein